MSNTKRPTKTTAVMVVQSSSSFVGYPDSTGSTVYSVEPLDSQMEDALFSILHLDKPWEGWIVSQEKIGGEDLPIKINPDAPAAIQAWAKERFANRRLSQSS